MAHGIRVSSARIYSSEQSESVQEVFDGLSDTGEDFKTASDKLKEYFEPKKNIRFERYIFKQASQNSSESISQFVTRLRSLSATCDFPDVNDAIADQVVEKCSSSRLKRRLLREKDLKLDNIIDISQAMESAASQTNQMDHSSRTENSLETPSEDNHQKLARINDKAAKCKMKSYADQKFHAKSSDLMQGDLVLVKQNKVNKLSTPFSAEPSVVLDVKGSMITLKRPNGKVYARNSSLLKRVPTTSNQLNKATSDSEDDIEDDSYAQRPNPVIPQPMRRNPRRHRNRPCYLNDYV
ncbi:hypothetical protein LOTGIDRAFT_157659 [Lottia gigantea]|uniref:Retrotransposon gag domain-containing protein n=1 Tax=Lottia gigantea TaxID=225164 RepID=V4CH87_LOTGI|nr:hypothetical protein LOTGIDRAFT_157659 [Lottia gigantea]ESP01470.1 hypothetical protein LOTGIDRAFT_157659 [Lottia gigantea]